MTHPAGIIIFGVVVAVATVAAVCGYLVGRPQAQSYGSRGGSHDSRSRKSMHEDFVLPKTPPPSTRRRRKSPERRSNPAVSVSTSTDEQLGTCRNCGRSSHLRFSPCNHVCTHLCVPCYEKYLEDNDTCPVCDGRIDSVTPAIPSFGKCRSCNKFTKLFKFLDCNHSLSLCIKCFEEKNERYEVCPECQQRIRGSEPEYATSGICGICHEFTRFAMFQPCGHGNFCRRHASLFLEISGEECSECGLDVTEVV